MNAKLNIAKSIKVGFQKRSDTYTGKLAYVISQGGKRKEDPKSWVNWRDKTIPPEEYPNEPTSGFVLNKDVGGTQRSYDWNARREKVRVYDPRDFEFEITVENVLLILQECSSIKGKGLEGEFVYAWSGSQLVLLPVCSQEYKTAIEFMDLGTKKVSAKEVVAGCTYMTKSKQQLMYLGKFDWCDYGYFYDRSGYGLVIQKGQHVFLDLDQSVSNKKPHYVLLNGFTKLATRTSDKPIPQFADAFEELNNSYYVSKPAEICLEDTTLDLSKQDYYSWSNKICVPYNGKYYIGYVRRYTWSYPSDPSKPIGYAIELNATASIKNGAYVEEALTYEERDRSTRKKDYTEQEVKLIVKDVYVKFENGVKYKIGER